MFLAKTAGGYFVRIPLFPDQFSCPPPLAISPWFFLYFSYCPNLGPLFQLGVCFHNFFRVLPNFHECFYNSIESRKMFSIFFLENSSKKIMNRIGIITGVIISVTPQLHNSLFVISNAGGLKPKLNGKFATDRNDRRQ